MESTTFVSKRNIYIFFRVIIISFLIQDVVCSVYSMNGYCTSELSLEKNNLHQLRVELNDEGIYGTDLSPFAVPGVCEATIEGWYATFPKLMFYFEYLELECENGYLQFFDGLNGTTKVPGLKGFFCGVNKPRGVYATNTGYIRILYVPAKRQFLHEIFSMVITSYSGGFCPSNGFQCRNSRCIHKVTACNDYNSCGDGSSCDLSIGDFVGFVAGCICSLLLIAIVMACYIRYQRIKSQGHDIVQYTTQAQASSQQELSFPIIIISQEEPSQEQNVSQAIVQEQGTSQPFYQGQEVSQPSYQKQGVSQPYFQEQEVSQPYQEQ